MAKRKAQFDAVEKYSKTPRKNNQEAEFSAEFAAGEEPIKGANRNSKKVEKGRGSIMKDRSNNKKTATNVEFGQEFGDINSAKYFEYQFMNQDNQKRKEKIDKNKN